MSFLFLIIPCFLFADSVNTEKAQSPSALVGSCVIVEQSKYGQLRNVVLNELSISNWKDCFC